MEEGGARVSTAEMRGAEHILEGLDPEQRQVAQSVGAPLCVLAGAGTGKTRAITHRIAYAIASGGYAPNHVLALTYTTKAAAEMRSRLRDLGVPAVQARTFHSAALRQLTYFWPSTVGGPAPDLVDRTLPLVGQAMSRLHMRVDPAALRDISAEVEWAKSSMIVPEEYPLAAARLSRAGVAGFEPRTLARIMTQYEDLKTELHLIDFADVLLLTATMIQEHPQMAHAVRSQYRHFTVDEYQDISPLQFRLLRAWLGNASDVCVVGDAAQTIYSYAGADSSYLLEFRKEFPRANVIRLERNYRSSPQIVQVANAVLARAQEGRDSHVELRAQRSDATRPLVVGYPDETVEAREVARSIAELLAKGRNASEIAILLRVNAHSERFEDALDREGVAYQVRGGQKFFERREVHEAMSALRAALGTGGGNDPDAGRVVRDVLSSRGWSSKAPESRGAIFERWASLNALVQVADSIAERAGATLKDVVVELEERREAQSAPVSEAVTIATVHAAKGLEWPVVFVVGASEGTFPISYAKTDKEIEEERRLFYVALTRARDVLTVTWAAARAEGAKASRKASRFIAGAFDHRDEGAAERVAMKRTTGRRGARVFTTCKGCGEALTTPGEQKVGRHAECGGEESAELFGRLRAWRRERASELKRPAFAVFTDSTLLAIADRAPGSLEELHRVPGVGQTKLTQFGEEVLAIISETR